MSSKSKGSAFERKVAKIFTDRFKKPFTRVPTSYGSGAWSTTHETQGLDLTNVAGDIIAPTNFVFNIECKIGYKINLWSIEPSKTLLDFFEQSFVDATRVGKIPLVVYKPDCQPIWSFVPLMISPEVDHQYRFGSWVGLPLAHLLREQDYYFFRKYENLSLARERLV